LFDLVVEGRTPVEGILRDIAICIQDGRVSDLRFSTPSLSETGEIHRLGSSILLPGFIDTHVHMRDPGLTTKEDFQSGTVSAAFGGVTTVFDMPNTIPSVRDGRSLQLKDTEAMAKAYVDYGLYLALDSSMDPDFLTSLTTSKDLVPPVAFKAFLGETTGSLSFGDIASLERFCPFLEGTGNVVAVHAEDGGFFRHPMERDRDEGVARRHESSRPAEAEASAIGKAIMSMGEYADRLHVLHVSSRAGLEASRGSRATLEATPHHLLLDIKWAEKNLDNEALVKVNPPIRSTKDRAALWKALLEGRIDTLGSDHAPHLESEKERGISSPSGIPGVETMAPLMLKEVSDRRLPLALLIDLLCTNPAKRFSMTKKGGLEIGKDADMVVLVPQERKVIRGEDLHSRCGWTPYEGMEAIFPSRVYSRGELVIEAGEASSKPGRGRNIKA
jgi:dihydroorotase